MIGRIIGRELGTFLIIGCLSVLIDFCTYQAGLRFAPLDASFAKAQGFIAGATFSYFANKTWTFGYPTSQRGAAQRFILLYGVTLAANVTINMVALNYLASTSASWASHIAFVLATGVSTILNFLGMKLSVFKTPNSKVRT